MRRAVMVLQLYEAFISLALTSATSMASWSMISGIRG
jgi:hypothetical protein